MKWPCPILQITNNKDRRNPLTCKALDGGRLDPLGEVVGNTTEQQHMKI